MELGSQVLGNLSAGCSAFHDINWGDVAKYAAIGAITDGTLAVALRGLSAALRFRDSSEFLASRVSAMRSERGAAGVPGRALSPNQMNQVIRRNGAPSGLVRVDRGKIPGEQTHVHFDEGSALNIDGTWKHGGRSLTNAQARWLESNGWKLPE